MFLGYNGFTCVLIFCLWQKKSKNQTKYPQRQKGGVDAGKITKLLITLDTNVKQINGKVSQLDTKFTKLDGKVSQLDTKFTKLDGKVSQLDTKFTKLDGKVSQLDTKFTKLDGEVGQIGGTINRLIDGQLKLDEKIDNLDEKLSEKIDNLDGRVLSVEKRIVSVEGKMNSLEGRMDSMETEMKNSFKTIVSYLISIEDEIGKIKTALDKKADKKDLDAIEQRVLRLEIELGECKKQIVTAKNRS
jgi:chromosome segregation ATPase